MKRIYSLLKTSTIKDTSISFIGLGGTAVFGFLFTIIMARVLGTAQYGVFSAVTALTAIIYNLGDLGISTAIINFLPKHQTQKNLIVNTGFSVQIIIAIFAILLFIIFSIFHQQIIPQSSSTFLILGGILAFNYLLIGFFQSVFTAERNYWAFSQSQVIDALLKIFIVVFLLLSSKLSIASALLANIISTTFTIFVIFFRQQIQITPDFNQSIFLKMYHFAKWTGVSRFFSVLFSRIDILLLNLLASSATAGIYSAASRITLLFSLLVSSLSSVINPRFSGFNTQAKVLKYIKKLSLFILGIAGLMIIAILLGKPIVYLTFGSEYQGAVFIFQLLTVAMIPFLFSLITTPAIIYTYNRPDFYAKTTALQVITIVILEIILIPILGIYAPVIALGITNLLNLFLSTAMLRNLIINDHRR